MKRNKVYIINPLSIDKDQFAATTLLEFRLLIFFLWSSWNRKNVMQNGTI
jgi:hypothetical protein